MAASIFPHSTRHQHLASANSEVYSMLCSAKRSCSDVRAPRPLACCRSCGSCRTGAKLAWFGDTRAASFCSWTKRTLLLAENDANLPFRDLCSQILCEECRGAGLHLLTSVHTAAPDPHVAGGKDDWHSGKAQISAPFQKVSAPTPARGFASSPATSTQPALTSAYPLMSPLVSNVFKLMANDT